MTHDVLLALVGELKCWLCLQASPLLHLSVRLRLAHHLSMSGSLWVVARPTLLCLLMLQCVAMEHLKLGGLVVVVVRLVCAGCRACRRHSITTQGVAIVCNFGL